MQKGQRRNNRLLILRHPSCESPSGHRSGIDATDITIAGGTVNASSNPNTGIWASNDFTISGGRLTASGGIQVISCLINTLPTYSKYKSNTG